VTVTQSDDGGALTVTTSVERLLTFREAADLLNISLRQLQRLVQRGEGPRVLVFGPKTRRISASALVAYTTNEGSAS